MITEFFLYLFIFINISSSLNEGKAKWIDEFEIKHSRWDWNYNSGTGYKQLISDFGGLSVVECGITESSSSSSYSDCSLLTFISKGEELSYETRLKFSNNNGKNDLGRGTKGFGFWDGIGDSFAWFISYSPESGLDPVGFLAQCRSSGKEIKSKKIVLDLTDWHNYRIDLETDLITFTIDGTEVASFPISMQNLKKCSIWVDNYQINKDHSREYLEVKMDEKLWIDWVKRYK